jgi:O-succinylbenzoate synthase
VSDDVRAVELIRIRLPLVAPFRNAHGTTTTKDALLVRVVTGDGEGWGEVGAEVAPTYAPDTLDSSRLVLRDELVPRLFTGASLDEVRGHHPARGALLNALLDARLRAAGTSLATHLGSAGTSVDAGVAIGIADDRAALVAAASAYVDRGYRSLKIKIAPGSDVAAIVAVRDAVGPDITLQADANGSYALADADRLAELDRYDVACLEQPLAPDALLDHARLSERVSTPIGLDESITGEGIVRDAIALRACRVVSIKNALLGGVDAARRVHNVCVAAGIAARAGGMLETGVGRAALVALASLPGFTVPGDLSASDRYFADDVTEPFGLDRGRLSVPVGAGLGVTPRPERLAQCTLAREWLTPS